jgi:hypothetical protein
VSSWSRNGFRENNVVIWQPNQIFEKFGREGDVPQGKSPFRLARRARENVKSPFLEFPVLFFGKQQPDAAASVFDPVVQ